MAPLADPTNYGNPPGQGPLRPGGQSKQSVDKVAEADLPSTPNTAAKRQSHALGIVRDLWGGTEKLRDQGRTYLPSEAAELPENYSSRLSRAVFFNAFRRTVAGLTGFVFAKDPKLGEDVPEPIVTQYENIDNAGTHGDVFLREQFQDALQTGHNAILVDYPYTNGEQTAADEQNGIRPYWVMVKKDNIVSWRTESENGKPVLSQLVLKECTMEAKGAYGEEEVIRYRVFTRSKVDTAVLVAFRLLRVVEGPSGKSVIEESRGLYPTQEEIPIAEVTTSGKRSLFDSDPPLMDLAYLNIAHYQERSDYQWSKHMTAVRTLVLIGFPSTDDAGQPVKIVTGPNGVLQTSNPDAKAEYLGYSDNSLTELREALGELKSEMGTMGLSMLAPQKRSAETAEAKRLDKQTESSDLAVSARGLQDAAERALGYHARYMKLESGGSIEINRDYDSELMDPAVMAAYVQLARDLGLPLRVVLDELKKGGRIGTDEDLDELEAEMVARAAEIEAQKAEEAEQRMKEMQASGGKPQPVAA